MEQEWYTSQISVICAWLTERADCSLHHVQLSALSQIVRVLLHFPFYLFFNLFRSVYSLTLSLLSQREVFFFTSFFLHRFIPSFFLPSFILIGLTSDDVNFLSHSFSACSFDCRRYITISHCKDMRRKSWTQECIKRSSAGFRWRRRLHLSLNQLLPLHLQVWLLHPLLVMTNMNSKCRVLFLLAGKQAISFDIFLPLFFFFPSHYLVVSPSFSISLPHSHFCCRRASKAGGARTSSRANSLTGGDEDVVARIQNATQNVTQNVMGKISGMSRMSSGLGGMANKLGGGFLKF